MRAEALIFAICTVFLVLITPAYWFIPSAGATGGDWTLAARGRATPGRPNLLGPRRYRTG